MSENNTRRRYDKEFKLETIQLLKSSGKKAHVIEKELGIGQGLISHWLREFENDPANAFRGNGNMTPKDRELADLRRENEILRQERDILKKAISIFSKTPG
jgi:transposase